MTPDNKIMDYVVGLEENLLKVKEENEKLKKRLSGYQHNHITRDIKEKGKCPACDLHHDKSEIQQLKSNLKIAVSLLWLALPFCDWRVSQVVEKYLKDAGEL